MLDGRQAAAMSEPLVTKPILDAIAELRGRPDEMPILSEIARRNGPSWRQQAQEGGLRDKEREAASELAGRLRQLLATAQQGIEEMLADLEQRRHGLAAAADVTAPAPPVAGQDHGGSAAGAYLSMGGFWGGLQPRGDASAAAFAAAGESEGSTRLGGNRDAGDPYAGARKAAAAGRRAEIEVLAAQIVEIQRALDML
jgi:hypothetical protein